MDIKSAEAAFQNVTYGDDSFQNLLHHLKKENIAPYHVSLFIGKAEQGQEDARQKIADATDRQMHTVDAQNIISKTETESYANLDRVFKKYDAESELFHLKNGSRLCGVYTGNSQSRVKYATPQERYFLKKIQEKGGMFVVSIDTETDADKTLMRAAQSVVHFPVPQSGLKKLFWKLKQVGTHGHEIKSERPEHYGKQSGNF